MGDIWGTLKTKAGPFPIGVWAAAGTIILALVLMRRKSKNAKTTQAAADQTNSDLGSAAQLANAFTVAGLMPYQGGDVYVNTTETKTPPPPGKPKPPPVKYGTDIQTSHFYKTTGPTNWDALAKKLGVFGGSGQALYQYNLIPNKHTPATLKAFKRTPKTVDKGMLIAVPQTGVNIKLPYVGVVKS